ncbi:DUF3131 domain-containing protein [Anabaena cylindrica UHCC 0172]|uniref:DUF3131 domain-containing protein n=1 Tax=Anabaena cylindrica TaxID=1165 RepID=UPI002B1EA584|nr:DUF3131 domain-containing protein [Anabaena cylindrica]MEA5552648.1 DUF3131 domain-containing protein [Anabaena cylindrica UHCC 0172]
MILELVSYPITNKQPFVCTIQVYSCVPVLIIAAPDNFYPEPQFPESSTPPKPIAPVKPKYSPPATTPSLLTPQPKIPDVPFGNISPKLTKEADKIAAQTAWKYFERNWNPQTGLVNSGDNYQWTTWWDQGSALLGIHAARQLGLLPTDLFKQRMNRLLETLETLPLPATGLPNKAYSTSTGQMLSLNNTPDPQGKSGWSALDLARFLLALDVMRSHYPEYSDRINRIVARWNLSKLVKNGWLNGAYFPKNGQIIEVQEGRLGYEQYAAHSLKRWNIHADKALSHSQIQHSQIQIVEVDGISLQVDKRNLKNSGATNYLTNDPYLLWGLELGWPDSIQPQIQNLLKLQSQRFKRTGILTAVNEDSLDRPPYFLYYSVYANGQTWQAINSSEKTYPQLRFLSTKAAFSWSALINNDPYTQKLRAYVQDLADKNRGYFSGKYENQDLGINKSIDVNTNAVILESLLYQARNKQPLID